MCFGTLAALLLLEFASTQQLTTVGYSCIGNDERTFSVAVALAGSRSRWLAIVSYCHSTDYYQFGEINQSKHAAADCVTPILAHNGA